ncbi:MAG: 30S ribosomal protein S8 [Microgenomates group bacterium]
MTDPIADFLIRIKNAALANHRVVTVPFSGIKRNLAQVLQKEKFLEKVEILEEGKKKQLVVTLAEVQGKPRTVEVKRISKPGKRVYIKAGEISAFKRGLGVIIISSPQGLMTADEAQKKHLGGEVICRII